MNKDKKVLEKLKIKRDEVKKKNISMVTATQFVRIAKKQYVNNTNQNIPGIVFLDYTDIIK